jgi:hypothetical protein
MAVVRTVVWRSILPRPTVVAVVDGDNRSIRGEMVIVVKGGMMVFVNVASSSSLTYCNCEEEEVCDYHHLHGEWCNHHHDYYYLLHDDDHDDDIGGGSEVVLVNNVVVVVDVTPPVDPVKMMYNHCDPQKK